MKNKILKWILGAIGVIVLGAIGSGLWDIGIKPVLSWFLQIILKITTLGISSLSDSFYQETARGLHVSEMISALIWLLCCICCWYFICYQRKSLSNHETNRVVLFVLLAFSLIQCIKHIYSKRLIQNFNQKFTIAKVALDEKEEEIILAKFSAMKNKKDYDNLIDILQQKVDNEVQPQLQQNLDKILQ